MANPYGAALSGFGQGLEKGTGQAIDYLAAKEQDKKKSYESARSALSKYALDPKLKDKVQTVSNLILEAERNKEEFDFTPYAVEFNKIIGTNSIDADRITALEKLYTQNIDNPEILNKLDKAATNTKYKTTLDLLSSPELREIVTTAKTGEDLRKKQAELNRRINTYEGIVEYDELKKARDLLSLDNTGWETYVAEMVNNGVPTDKIPKSKEEAVEKTISYFATQERKQKEQPSPAEIRAQARFEEADTKLEKQRRYAEYEDAESIANAYRKDFGKGNEEYDRLYLQFNKDLENARADDDNLKPFDALTHRDSISGQVIANRLAELSQTMDIEDNYVSWPLDPATPENRELIPKSLFSKDYITPTKKSLETLSYLNSVGVKDYEDKLGRTLVDIMKEDYGMSDANKRNVKDKISALIEKETGEYIKMVRAFTPARVKTKSKSAILDEYFGKNVKGGYKIRTAVDNDDYEYIDEWLDYGRKNSILPESITRMDVFDYFNNSK